MHHTIRQAIQEAELNKKKHGFKFMAVQDHVLQDGSLRQFMGLPIGHIILWKPRKKIVLFVSQDQRDLYLRAFPDAIQV